MNHVTDRDEEWTPDGIPNTWVDEEGIRHIVVFDETLPVRYEFINGELQEVGVF